MRSKLITTTLLLAAVALLIPTGAGAGESLSTTSFQRAIMKFSEAQDRTVPAIPAHLPAPATSTGIGPGAHLLILFDDDPGFIYGCTANFIWRPSTGTTRYLGAAGHCFVPAGKTGTHGPGADYNASRTHVKVCVSGCSFGGETGFLIQGSTVDLGPVVYSRQTQGGVDVGNDFGIITIPTANASLIRASIPVWGGPTSTGAATLGGLLCLYGNGVGVGETFLTMARAGIGVDQVPAEGYWAAALPSAEGDSGSAVETCGQDAGGLHGFAAVGILTHIAPGWGGIVGTTVARAISMATQAGLTISLVPGS